jgi:hypothetical protein
MTDGGAIMSKTPRSSERKTVRWPTTWWVWDQSGPGVLDEGALRDVSAEGAFLEPFSFAAHPLWPGTRIRIEFASPTRQGETQLSGTVRWVGLHKAHRCGGVGIEFEARSNEIENELRNPSSKA